MIEKNVFICLVIQKIIYTFALLFALSGNCINNYIFLDKGWGPAALFPEPKLNKLEPPNRNRILYFTLKTNLNL